MIIHNSTYDENTAATVSGFAAYSDQIESLLMKSLQSLSETISSEAADEILNGKASLALQNLVPLAVRKEAGIFFTGTALADKVAEQLAPLLIKGTGLCDPATGAGNLLVACAKYLPRGKNLQETLQNWTQWLIGYDLFPEFIRATKLRLLVAAAKLHGNHLNLLEIDREHVFESIKQGNVFSFTPPNFSECLVMNPPFGSIPAPEDCQWASGAVQAAGWFLEKLLRDIPEGHHIVAILPDVLNSGTRYRKWREIVSSYASTLTVEAAGRFDTNTDVDVFILHIVTGKRIPSLSWPHVEQGSNPTLAKVSDYFDVHVGSVVPHRDTEEGPEYPYIHARTASRWKTLRHIKEHRRFSGTVFTPPFVVVHRTSSPQDRYRCVGSIIERGEEVAVENHLLVLLPKDNRIETCKLLISRLQDKRTNIWFNRRIRCRHLTTSSVGELPWWVKERH